MTANALPTPPPVPTAPATTGASDVPCAVVVLAAGSGSRVGATVDGQSVNKVLLPLAGDPVITHSVRTALAVPGLRQLVVVARPGEEQAIADAILPLLDENAEVRLVTGGASRHASEWAGIRAVASEIESGEVEVVVVHDGARPLASVSLYRAVVEAAAEHGGAVPVAPARSLVTLDDSPAPEATVAVQTPQAFAARTLLAAYRAAAEAGFEGTDTASCLEAHSPAVRIAAVGSGAVNMKVTFPEDVTLAAALMARV